MTIWEFSRAAAIAALVGVASSASATTGIRYVDDDAPADGTGLTWTSAYRYLQDALHETGIAEIRVAAGVYKPDEDEGGNVTSGDRGETFAIRTKANGRGSRTSGR